MDFIYLYRLVPVLFFLHPFISAWKKKNKIAQLTCGLYLFSAIGSLFVSKEYLIWHDFKTDTFLGFFFYSLFNLPLLYISHYIKPFSNIDRIRLDFITKLFLLFFGIGAVFSFIYQLPFALKALSMSAYEVRTMEESLLPSSLFTTIAVGFPMFLFIYVFFFFVSVIKRWNKFITLTMFLGSVSFVINVLTVSGRDGFVFFIFAYIFSYYLFEIHLNKRVKQYFRSIAFIGLTALILIGTSITIDRFSRFDTDEVGAIFQIGVLNYFSMQPFTFNDVLKYHDNFSFGADNFPLFYSLFFEYIPKERNVSMPYMYNFSGYVGSFYKNGGYLYLSCLIFLFFLFFKKIKKMYSKFYLYQFSLLSFYFFFMTSGVFYFRMGNKGGNIFILLSLLMMFFLRYRLVIKRN